MDHSEGGSSLEIDLTQRVVDLAYEGFDVALRTGSIKQSRLIARRVGEIRWVPVASPAYLERHGAVTGPRDLLHRALLEFFIRGSRTWRFQSASKAEVLPLPRHTTINHISVLKELTLRGRGISLLPTYHVQHEIKNGELVRIMPAWSTGADPIYAVYPEQRRIAAKVRAFLDFIAIFLKMRSYD